jgi:hypothetical protein
MAEHFTFHELVADCRATHINQRLFGSGAEPVYGAGNQLFTGAIFSANQYPGIRGGGDFNIPS